MARVLRFQLGVLVLASITAALAQNRGSSQAADVALTGNFVVKTARDLVLHDGKRNKDLPLNVLYPDGAGAFPVIVFSHGAGASKDSYTNLTTFWASHGYVVIQPTHADSVTLRHAEGDESADIWQAADTAINDSRAWQDRPRDISFVLDSLPEIESMASQLRGKMDAKEIAVAGHSFGAFTAEVIGGATFQVPGGSSPLSFRDKRVKAIIAMSGQGPGEMGLTEDSWKNMDLPVMTMTGSRDRGAGGQGPDWRKLAFDFSPAGDKYHVFIDGANHLSFTGRMPEVPATGLLRRRLRERMAENQEAIFHQIEFYSQVFWDAYLGKDSSTHPSVEELENSGTERVRIYRK